jgi:hypothetical protein
MNLPDPTHAARVFVDGVAVAVPPGATALDAVRAADAAAAEAVLAGARVITDSRGLPVANDTPVHGGAIFRLVSARVLRAAIEEEQEL